MILLDKDNFESEVLNANGLVVVDFWGEGCQPCSELMPEFEALASNYVDQVKFAKLNTTKDRRLAISQRVLGLPTVVLYKDGQRVAECTKESASKTGITQMLEAHL